MMHYCSVDALKTLVEAAPRFESTFEMVRNAVTSNFNNYIRRDLSYSDNVIEYHDAVTLPTGQPYYIYLDKRRIDKDIPIQVQYEPGRNWPRAKLLTPEIDYEKSRITLFGPTRYGKSVFRITYAGGYKATEDDEEVMDCPSELTVAAIQQCQFDLNALLNSDAGHTDSDRGRNTLQKEKTVDGLLLPVSRVLDNYKKLFARVV